MPSDSLISAVFTQWWMTTFKPTPSYLRAGCRPAQCFRPFYGALRSTLEAACEIASNIEPWTSGETQCWLKLLKDTGDREKLSKKINTWYLKTNTKIETAISLGFGYWRNRQTLPTTRVKEGKRGGEGMESKCSGPLLWNSFHFPTINTKLTTWQNGQQNCFPTMLKTCGLDTINSCQHWQSRHAQMFQHLRPPPLKDKTFT